MWETSSERTDDKNHKVVKSHVTKKLIVETPLLQNWMI